MNYGELIEIGLNYPATQLKHPFGPETPVLYVGSRMFALFGVREGEESVNLKTYPDEAWLQRETYPGSVLPGYHMNKRHWNTVLLGGGVPEETIVQMLEDSYRLVAAKLTRAEKDSLGLALRSF